MLLRSMCDHCAMQIKFHDLLYLSQPVVYAKYNQPEVIVLYLTKIILLKICILHCLVPLNSILFKPRLFRVVKIVLIFVLKVGGGEGFFIHHFI